MHMKKTAVVEDIEAFKAWLATTPLMISVAEKRRHQGQASHSKKAGPSAADLELAEALKSMA